MILFYVCSIPLGRHIWNGKGIQRFNQVSILKSTLNPGIKFIKSYVLHFSPLYLYKDGDKSGVLRHGLSGAGEFYIWDLLGLMLGVYYLWKQKIGVGWLVLFLFIIYPTPSSITIDLMPLATRSVMGLVPFTFVTGYGYYELIRGCLSHKKRYILIFLFVVLFVSSAFYTYQLVHIYEKEAGGYLGWQFGMEESIRYLKNHENEYDALYITHRFNSPEELLLFFNRTIHCSSCRIMSNPIAVDQYHKQLFAIRSEDIEEAYQQYEDAEFIKLKTIRDPGGTAQLYIGYFIFTSSHSGK